MEIEFDGNRYRVLDTRPGIIDPVSGMEFVFVLVPILGGPEIGIVCDDVGRPHILRDGSHYLVNNE